METQLRSLRYSADLDPSKYVAGMNAKVAADRAGTASSVAVGAAIGQTDQKVSAAGDPLVRLSRQYVEGFRGAEQLNRAVATLGRGIDSGNVPLERADAILDGIYRKYGLTANAADLMERGQIQLAGAVTAANARWAQQAGQIDTVTAAANRLAVANDNVRVGGHNTANIAAQFQDIGVTAAMGMSPIMIALQQGTQLSAALGNQGLRGTVMSLGAAFGSVLSPVSLLTIGVVALGAVGIQSLMGIGDSADDASSALETHKKWLDEILYGYDAARKAANDSADAAQKLPQGVVQADLQAGLARGVESYADAIANAARKQVDLNALTSQWITLRSQSASSFPDDTARIGRFDALIEQAQQLATLEVNANSTTAQLESVMSITRQVMTTASDPAIKNLATQIYDLASGMRSARGEISSTQSAIAALQAQAFRGLGVDAALKQIVQMTPELRTSRQVVADLFALNAPQARTMSELQALADATAKFNADMTEQERRQQAIKDARSGGKTTNQWDAANDNFQQRIDQTRMEIAALGQSTYTVERNKAAFELLNQAKQAGIPITSAVTAGINTMAAEYASAQVALERQTEAILRQNEEIDFYKGTLGSFLSQFKSDLMNGVSMWDAFANAASSALDRIADRALGMAADGIFDMIFGAITGAFTGGGSLGNDIGSGIAGMFGGGALKLNAAGGVYQSSSLSAYSNSIVNRPTMFAFAQGAGLMGEAGPEAIMPLRRTASGALGVVAANSNIGAANSNWPVVQIIDQRRGGSIQQQQATGPNGEKQLRMIIRDEVQQAQLRGAMGF